MIEQIRMFIFIEVVTRLFPHWYFRLFAIDEFALNIYRLRGKI